MSSDVREGCEGAAGPTFTRRGVLGMAGIGAGLTALARLPWAASLPVSAADGQAVFFAPAEREIFLQIAERMVATGVAGAPGFGETRALETVESLLVGLAPELSAALPLALKAFEYGPFVFDFKLSRFTAMSDAERDASLRAWMTSRFGFRRQAFLALRNLCFLGYYAQKETWPLIDYHGPLVGLNVPVGGTP